VRPEEVDSSPEHTAEVRQKIKDFIDRAWREYEKGS
jgi:hypothetical protein